MSSVTDAVRHTLPTSIEKLLLETSEAEGGVKDVTRPGAAGTRKPEVAQTAKLGGIPMLYDPVLNRGMTEELPAELQKSKTSELTSRTQADHHGLDLISKPSSLRILGSQTPTPSVLLCRHQLQHRGAQAT